MTSIPHSALDTSVLVLNKWFMPIHFTSVRQAFCLLRKELAEVVSLEDGQFTTDDFGTWSEVSEYRARNFRQADDDWVRTSRAEIQAPRIIRLPCYDWLPKQPVKFNRRNIFIRDNNQCQFCGKKFPTSELSLDHVTPRSQGGQTTWENVVCACVACMARKSGRTPREAHMALILKPEKPKRSPLRNLKLLNLKLTSSEYQWWKSFLENACRAVELRDAGPAPCGPVAPSPREGPPGSAGREGPVRPVPSRDDGHRLGAFTDTSLRRPPAAAEDAVEAPPLQLLLRDPIEGPHGEAGSAHAPAQEPGDFTPPAASPGPPVEVAGNDLQPAPVQEEPCHGADSSAVQGGGAEVLLADQTSSEPRPPGTAAETAQTTPLPPNEIAPYPESPGVDSAVERPPDQEATDAESQFARSGLAARLPGVSPGRGPTLQDPSHASDFSWVKWGGVLYKFTPMQAQAIGLLWLAWERGEPAVRHDTILVEIDSKSPRLRDLFKRNAAWGTLIIKDFVKGTYRLNVELLETSRS
jgi:5-methylcytosine-specific restriction endonuclease McrA